MGAQAIRVPQKKKRNMVELSENRNLSAVNFGKNQSLKRNKVFQMARPSQHNIRSAKPVVDEPSQRLYTQMGPYDESSIEPYTQAQLHMKGMIFSEDVSMAKQDIKSSMCSEEIQNKIDQEMDPDSGANPHVTEFNTNKKDELD